LSAFKKFELVLPGFSRDEAPAFTLDMLCFLNPPLPHVVGMKCAVEFIALLVSQGTAAIDEMLDPLL
jgi:hypothetical protein